MTAVIFGDSNWVFSVVFVIKESPLKESVNILGAEFIHLIASEASDISERQQKKVISPEHVVEALTTLGFQEYVVDVKAVHKEYKEQASVSGRGLAQQLHMSCDSIVSLETPETWAEQTGQARDSRGGTASSATTAL